MHGSPCQDFSLAGKQAGGDEGSGTRSSLMYETIRIVEKIKPKYVIWENVKNVLSKKHKHNFDNYINKLEQLGYISYYQVLNAKDYGIPQNRERVFTVSIRKDVEKDFEFPSKQNLNTLPIDYLEENVNKKYNLTKNNIKNYNREFGSKGKEINLFEPIPTLVASMGTGGGNIPYFIFPPKEELKLRLKDMLEKSVDEKYYLSDKFIQGLLKHNEHHKEKGTGFIWKPRDLDGVASTLRANGALAPTDNTIQVVGKLDIKGHDCVKRVYSGEGISPTLTDMQGGNRQPKVAVAMRGRYNESGEVEQQLEISSREIANSITTVQKDSMVGDGVVTSDMRVRKLTPLECWRLMGFDDEDIDKCIAVGVSNTQLYKQAGNSIVVNVLEKIFKNLLEETNE